MYDWTDDGRNVEIFVDNESVGRLYFNEIIAAYFRPSIHDEDELSSITLVNGNIYVINENIYVNLSKNEKNYLKKL